MDNSSRLNGERREKWGEKRKLEAGKEWEEDQDPNAMPFSSNPELTLPLGKSCSVDCPLFEETISRTTLLLGSSLVVRPSATAAARVHSVQGEIGSFTAAAAAIDGRPLEFSDRGRGRRAG